MQMPSRSRSLQVLGAALRPSASRHVFTVLEIEQAGVPGATTWFRVRPAEPGGTMPTPVVPDGSTPSGQWFSRAAPTGAQFSRQAFVGSWLCSCYGRND